MVNHSHPDAAEALAKAKANASGKTPLEIVDEIFLKLRLDKPSELRADGNWHHFAPDSQAPKRQPMSYRLHLDSFPLLGLYDFRKGQGDQLSFYPLIDGDLTDAQKKQYETQTAAAKAQRKKELEELQARAAKQGQHIWDNSPPADPKYPYVANKGIQPHIARQYTGPVTKADGTVKQYKNVLVIPARRSGKIVGLQFINAEGGKWFLDGTSKDGASCIIGDIKTAKNGVLLEGFATTSSVFEATGSVCVSAFDGDNLPKVARTLKLMYPEIEWSVGADDDWKRLKPGTDELENYGLIKAAEAAKVLGCEVVVPKFSGNRGEKDTDFNDLHKAEGLDAVRACFELEEAAADAPELQEPQKETGPQEGPEAQETAEPDAVEPKKTPLPSRFGYAEDGSIEHVIGRTEKGEPIWAVLCSPIEFLARTEDVEGKRGGLVLRIMNDSGKWHKLAITRSDLVAADDLLRLLMDHGLRIMTSGRDTNAFKRLLNWVFPERRARCVPNIGWSGNAFVFPDEVIGQPEDVEVIYQPASLGNHAYRTCGTFEDWKSGVAVLARGNSRIQLALSTALAGPLLRLVPMEGGGIHLRGASSTGKTTSLQAAGSIWGGGASRGLSAPGA